MQALHDRTRRVAGRRPLSEEHFNWLALYQCANASLESIVALAKYGDKATVSKGMHNAAKLACIRIRPKGKEVEIASDRAFSTDLTKVPFHPDNEQGVRTTDAQARSRNGVQAMKPKKM